MPRAVGTGVAGRSAPDLAAAPLPLPTAGPILRDEFHERLCIVTELERQASRWRIVHVDGLLASPVTRIDRFTTSERTDRRR